MLYSMCFLLFIIGLYCVLVKKNMVKIVLGIVIMEYAVNLFLIMLGYRLGGIAPIVGQNDYASGAVDASFTQASVDPLPQAMVLTAIVISLGSLALMISICIRTYERYGTFDITQIRRLKG
ncbi:MAG: sodium:proton antiporter [Phycisphaerae bacterium]|nr:sodium:proton antiporter [Phycisphaerae bacterium]